MASPSLPPTLTVTDLYRLAQRRRDLWPAIAEHPNAYPDLLDFLAKTRDPEIQAALARRDGGKGAEKNGAASASRRKGGQETPADVSQPASSPSDPPRKEAEKDSAASVPKGKGAGRSDGATVTSSDAATTPTDSCENSPLTDILIAGLDDAPDDRTMISKRVKVPLALLSWGEGEPVPLTEPVVIVGRRVSADDHRPAQTVRVPDTTRTISGTHAKLHLSGGTWYIEDLHSTNGIYFAIDGGNDVEVRGKTEVTGDFYLGDVRFHLEPKG